MRYTIICCGLILLETACAYKSEKTIKADSLAINAQTPEKSDSIKAESISIKPKTFDEINKTLFDNLVNGEFGPHAIENDSGYYVIGIDSYTESLRELGIFSEEFYKHEEERVKDCKSDLEKLKHTGDTDLGWAPNSCFFDFMYWLRSQESPKGFEVKNLETKDSVAKSTMVFYVEYDGVKTYWNNHVYLDIHYRKEGNEWRVTEILRLPND